jgi:hypothetical protein
LFGLKPGPSLDDAGSKPFNQIIPASPGKTTATPWAFRLWLLPSGGLTRPSGGVRGDFDFALVVGADGDGHFVFVLVNRDDFAEIDGKERMLIQSHITFNLRRNLPFVEFY